MALANVLKHAERMRVDRSTERFIPYTVPVGRDAVKTRAGDYVRTWLLEGIPYECDDDEKVNAAFWELNDLLCKMANPHVALWTHIVRRELEPSEVYPDPPMVGGFAGALDRRYRTETQFYRNDHYVTLVYRPIVDTARKVLAKLDRLSVQERLEREDDWLHKFDQYSKQLANGLAVYHPEALSTYEEDGTIYSKLYEFFDFLVNGTRRQVPFYTDNLSGALGRSRPVFMYERAELRASTQTIHVAALGINRYKTPVGHDMLNALLRHNGELVVAQSFVFMSLATAEGSSKQKTLHMLQMGDHAQSQIAQIKGQGGMLDELTSDVFVMGEHQLHVLVKASDPKELLNRYAAAEEAIKQITPAREDIGLQAAFWAQLPGNFKFRARPSMISSEDFAAFSPFHGFSQGKKYGNHWGNAVMVLPTRGRTPYYFDWFDGDVGHGLVLGMTGSGKDVFVHSNLTWLLRRGVTVAYYDKSRGAEPFIRLYGRYLVFRHGHSTGCNPFQLAPTKENVQFVQSLVRGILARKGEELSTARGNMVDTAVENVFVLDDPELRRLRAVSDFLTDRRDEEGMYARLQRWIKDGPNAWVFDGVLEDSISFNTRITGFDFTEVMGDDEVRVPIRRYLFYRQQALYDGRPFVTIANEFHELLSDPFFEAEFYRDFAGARYQNRILIGMTQNIQRAMATKIGPMMRTQTPTVVVLKDPKANADDYVRGLSFSEKEFEMITRLSGSEHEVFVKKPDHAVVVSLPLDGFDDELVVLSSRKEETPVLDRLRDELGDDPRKWLAPFQQEAKAMRAQHGA